MNWAVISILALVGIIVIANVRNINIGLLGIAAALVIGLLGGMKLKDIYSGFGTQLFLRMLSLQCLIAVARNNGTLKVVANSILKICGGKLFKLMPVIIFIGCGLASWFNFGLNQLMIPIIIALAFELSYKDPMKLGFVIICNALAFNYSPYTSTGVNVLSNVEGAGMSVNMWSMGIVQFICGFLVFIGLYFFYGWHKEKAVEMSEHDIVEVNWKNWLTIAGYLVFIILNVFFKMDMMVTPLCVAMILLMVGAADTNAFMKSIPWGTLIMLGGMAVMVGVIDEVGGIALISSGISAVSSKGTAPAVLALLCGSMSTVSSANGVVIPTMIAAIPDISQSIVGVDMQALIYAVGIGAFGTAISPLSTVGGMIMAAHGTCYNPSEKERQGLFNKLFVFTFISIGSICILALVGLFRLHIFG